MKLLDTLNDEKTHKFFESNETPNKDIILIYRLFLQFINKEKIDIKNKDDNEIWKLVKEKIYQKDKLIEHIKELLKDLDISDENLIIINNMIKDCNKEKIMPKYFNKICPTTSVFSMLVKEILEYYGILIGKKTPIPMQFRRLSSNLKNLKDNEEKLNNLKV